MTLTSIMSGTQINSWLPLQMMLKLILLGTKVNLYDTYKELQLFWLTDFRIWYILFETFLVIAADKAHCTECRLIIQNQINVKINPKHFGIFFTLEVASSQVSFLHKCLVPLQSPTLFWSQPLSTFVRFHYILQGLRLFLKGYISTGRLTEA